ncbi:hypothetical protein [Microbacterium sp. No. 7]|uniref:hypothetical protein n=1 Tax=Microbacterium sp. No. 7 TaxID=1714373 RepID=UPI0006D0CD42|nr:hypothetical protein [Microbacterium sp. No. 7]ALJ19486.1 helicase [Microbacterium sp. No. 7]
MAGTAVAAGVLAATAVFAAGVATAGAASVRSVQVAGVADAAALAAADAASGAVPGVPCERAGQLAARGGATLVACEVDGLVAVVEVSAPFGVFAASARARAGPPSAAR